MLLKICYKPNGFYYINGVASIDFDSNVSTDINIDVKNNHLYNKETPMPGRILVSKEFLDESRGACAHEEDNRYYINNISFTVCSSEQSLPVEDFVAFTGYAYLCDDSGKTIDVLK